MPSDHLRDLGELERRVGRIELDPALVAVATPLLRGDSRPA
jgi:hypothetical protein